MKIRTLLPVLALAGAFQAHAADPHAAAEATEGGHRPAHAPLKTVPNGWDSYFNLHNLMVLPKDRVPPHGQCAVWYPGKSASEQPAFSACSADISVAPGGVLISGARDVSALDVTVYDATTPGLVIGRATYGTRSASIQRVTYPTAVTLATK